MSFLATASICFAFGCKDIERPPLFALLSGSGGKRIGVVSTDLGSAGRFTSMTPDGVPIPGISPVYSDAVARFQRGRVTIINRLNRDNIQVLDPTLGFLTTREFSVGSGSNPHDFVEVDDGKGFVSLYEKSFLQIVQPATGALVGNIPLGGFADADGIPEMDGMHLEGNILYVALQRLDRNQTYFPPTGVSKLIEIDVRNNQTIGVYDFPFPNPFGKFKRVLLSGVPHLIIACPGRVGFLSALDGGVVAFNLNTRSFRPGTLFTEVAAGGDILDVEIANETVGYASVLDSAFNKFLLRFDPSTGQRLATVSWSPASAGYFSGILLVDDLLYAADASFSQPGVRIYDARSNVALTPVPVDVGLRPSDMIYIPGL
ncbi:MAG: hypothetical protein JNM27_07045 [Leptospirales bacterium]|nr:hypothetical protein [Leptospirales bacterium]